MTRRAGQHPHHSVIAEFLVNALQEWGAYIYYEAQTGSVYIKFPHWALGSIRIGDHTGIQKYRYRWRVRTDKPSSWQRLYKDNGIWVFEVGPKNLQALVDKFIETAIHRGVKPGDEETFEQRKVHHENQ